MVMAPDLFFAPLQQYRIPDIPEAMYYIPNFITESEETHIVSSILPSRWTQLTHRRLQSLPSRLTATNTLLASPLPSWLTDPVIPRILSLGIFGEAQHGINHCLINEYLPGQGIMPHEDGGAYYPVVATVSLSGTLVLDVSEKRSVEGNDEYENMKRWRILQEPRSLLVTTGAAYTDTLHGIADVSRDENLSLETVANWTLLGDSATIVANGGSSERTTRISLTYRDVKKVSTLGSKIFGKSR